MPKSKDQMSLPKSQKSQRDGKDDAPQPPKSPETPDGNDKPQEDNYVGLPSAGEGGDEIFEDDFTEVDSAGFELVEEGSHHAKVIDFEKTMSRTGNPQYVWQFRITAGNSKDREIRYWTSLLPQARWKAAEALTAVGIEAVGSVAKFKKSDVLGKPCILDVTHEQFEGRTTNKVRRMHPPNDDSIKFAKGDDTPF